MSTHKMLDSLTLPTFFQEKLERVRKKFSSFTQAEERYAYLMELGRNLTDFRSEWRRPENIVSGCQSILFLHTERKDQKLFFYASSEALISAGLAALLIGIYQGETPEIILKNPPTLLHDLGIQTSLSPGRSNGLSSLYLRMKQEALKSFFMH